MDQPHGEFISPTIGRLNEDRLFSEIIGYISGGPGHRHRVIVGTDSFLSIDTIFVSAIVIHRVGRGGRYFYRRTRGRKIPSMRQRIVYEATMSIELAGLLTARLGEHGHAGLPVEIHIDVGERGESRDIIREVVGMVRGSGYEAVTKPDSYGASKVADRHSR